MSFIISWSGYFSRKRWDPKLWAKANDIVTYPQCVKRISKMHVRPPTEDQFNELFLGLTKEDIQSEIKARQIQRLKEIEDAKPEVTVKVPKPESPPKPPPQKEKETPPVEKKASPAKRRPRKKVVKKADKPAPPAAKAGSGTSSIIESVKKKPAAKRSRSKKNVKSS